MTGVGHLVLRADASSTIGTGHAMRLLALSQAWRDGGGTAELLAAELPDGVRRRYEAEGVAVRAVPADDPGSLVGAVDGTPGAVAVVDGPAFDATWLDALAPIRDRLLVVDDMAALPHYPAALVLNQNAHAARSAYPPDGEGRYLLGLRYVLLRREFAEVAPRPPAPDMARTVLVTFGGADPTGMTARTLDALAAIAGRGVELEVVAIAGSANRAADAIRAAVAAGPLAARLDTNVDDMTSRMTWADLAVVSAGSTVWELARVGCPALVVETAPAEPHLARGIRSLGLFDTLGSAGELTHDALVAAIARRIGDREWRRRMSSLGPSLVDGQGAVRVAGSLRALPGSAG
jgi:UDP-2,4-diacetamido-2,4,6-trideoxy-beta-L-altropyranose hydrolase